LPTTVTFRPRYQVESHQASSVVGSIGHMLQILASTRRTAIKVAPQLRQRTTRAHQGRVQDNEAGAGQRQVAIVAILRSK
jgi:hypothetical protein